MVGEGGLPTRRFRGVCGYTVSRIHGRERPRIRDPGGDRPRPSMSTIARIRVVIRIGPRAAVHICIGKPVRLEMSLKINLKTLLPENLAPLFLFLSLQIYFQISNVITNRWEFITGIKKKRNVKNFLGLTAENSQPPGNQLGAIIFPLSYRLDLPICRFTWPDIGLRPSKSLPLRTLCVCDLSLRRKCHEMSTNQCCFGSDRGMRMFSSPCALPRRRPVSLRL